MPNKSQYPHVHTLSVVIPVYNEQSAIEKILQDWVTELCNTKISFQLILINDGSTDNSLLNINNWMAKHPEASVQVISQPNQGHGASILNGYQLALAHMSPWIFQCDSDDQIEAKNFSKLWSKTANFDFILGQRLDRHDPIVRLVMSKIMRLWVFLLYGLIIPDPNCPFRLFKRDFLQDALTKIPPNPFAPNIHLSIEAFKYARNGILKCKTVPIIHQSRQTGVPSLKGILKLATISLRVIRELITHRWQR
ncbi:MAG: glycosyltransferase family 2 protein [Bdellovibrio sp.]|nr:glycosyltransferase family 2 protein [Bdellovibrio sp.]